MFEFLIICSLKIIIITEEHYFNGITLCYESRLSSNGIITHGGFILKYLHTTFTHPCFDQIKQKAKTFSFLFQTISGSL